MEPAITPDLRWPLTLLSACLAALVYGLLAYGLRKMRSTDIVTRLGWWAAGSLTAGGGLGAAQFVALGGLSLPWTDLRRAAPVAVTWLVAVAGIALILATARLRLRDAIRLPAQAGLLAALWLAVLAGGLSTLGVQPADRGWAGLPLGAAGLVLAAALLGFWMLLGRGWARLGSFAARQWTGAVLFGLLAGMAQEMALGSLLFLPAAGIAPGAVIEGWNVELAAVAASLALLLGLFGAALDSRAHGRNQALASSLREANRRLRDLALADPLTRLPNRLLFEERLEEALDHAGHEPGSLAVLFIDLDGFKPINDSFGHVAGDSVLREVGRRLQGLTRQSDTVARVGGDEFLLMAEAAGGELGAAEVAQCVLQAIGQPYILPNGVEVNLSCSVGIVMYPEHGPAAKLLANADAAMYAAKRAGGSTYAFFEPSMEQDARNQLALQRDLRNALEHNELELYYQPKIDGRSGQITGVEALVRWHHPTRGLVMPSVFIPVAERFGLIGTLGNWVIEESCRQLRAWQDEGLRMRVSLNLSVHQLRQEDLVPRIRRAVERNGIEASLLTFEITESAAMEDTAVTMRALAHLARVGATVSIDDFGTGYSSLAYLRKLPARQLKIDRSFVMDLDHSGDALAVVDAVIKLAHALGLRVVAEGVETERQRDILLSLHCDELQGYLYAKPMSASRLTLWSMGDEGVEPAEFRPSLYV